jgi:hypothetical protein
VDGDGAVLAVPDDEKREERGDGSIPAVATAGQHLHARGAGQGMVCGDHALRRHDLVLSQR